LPESGRVQLLFLGFVESKLIKILPGATIELVDAVSRMDIRFPCVCVCVWFVCVYISDCLCVCVCDLDWLLSDCSRSFPAVLGSSEI
jgi:hypothetical protein